MKTIMTLLALLFCFLYSKGQNDGSRDTLTYSVKTTGQLKKIFEKIDSLRSIDVTSSKKFDAYEKVMECYDSAAVALEDDLAHHKRIESVLYGLSKNNPSEMILLRKTGLARVIHSLRVTTDSLETILDSIVLRSEMERQTAHAAACTIWTFLTGRQSWPKDKQAVLIYLRRNPRRLVVFSVSDTEYQR